MSEASYVGKGKASNGKPNGASLCAWGNVPNPLKAFAEVLSRGHCLQCDSVAVVRIGGGGMADEDPRKEDADNECVGEAADAQGVVPEIERKLPKSADGAKVEAVEGVGPSSGWRTRLKMIARSKANLASIALALCFAASVFIGLQETGRLSTEYQELLSEIAELQNENSVLSSDYDALKVEHATLEKEARSLQSKLDDFQDQQATIHDATAKLEEMHSQYDSLLTERDSLLEQVDAKKASEEQAAREREQRELEKSSNAGGTVYWVAGGEVYHSTPNCPSLKRSSNIQSGSIAASGKSRACKICG